MKFVWLLMDQITNNVVAIYDNNEMAVKMMPHLEKKLNVTLSVVRRSVNQEFSRIGLDT